MEELNIRILDQFVREEGSEEENGAWDVVRERAKSNGIKPLLCDGWRDVSEKPQNTDVKCDKFVVCDMNHNTLMMYYFYDEDRWSINGDDTQKILKWYRVPPAFA